MAKAKMCDRCGKFYTLQNKLINIPTLSRNLFAIAAADDSKTVDEMWALMDAQLDLCNDCSESLRKWLTVEQNETKGE